jgi:phage-related protein
MADEKPLVWLSGEVKTPPFSREARLEAGGLLRQLQRGERLGLPHSRPMPEIATGCHELRIKDSGHNWRIVYHVAREAVVVLDVFSKKTNATPKTVITASRRRLGAFQTLMEERDRSYAQGSTRAASGRRMADR